MGQFPKVVVYIFLNLVCWVFTLPMAQAHDTGREVQSTSRAVFVVCVFEIRSIFVSQLLFRLHFSLFCDLLCYSIRLTFSHSKNNIPKKV